MSNHEIAKFYYVINYRHFSIMTKDFDECILAKMFFLYSSILSDEDVEDFLYDLFQHQSTETINSLVANVPFLLNYYIKYDKDTFIKNRHLGENESKNSYHMPPETT